MTPAAFPYSPPRALWLLLLTKWRQHRCAHIQWSPLDPCPDCGKA